MSERTLVREATPRDLPALAALEKRGFPVDFFTLPHLRYLLTRARAITFVMEVCGAVAGSAIMAWRKNSTEGSLYSIVIDPDYQGRGLGRRLLQEAEDAVARRGCASVLLETRVDNTPAIALYERHGYRRTGVVRGFYADGADALVMEKTLEHRLAREVRLEVPYLASGHGPGPAATGSDCLIMALTYLAGERAPRLWAEGAQPLGEGPLHLAMAAQSRGFPAKVLLPQTPGSPSSAWAVTEPRLAREARSLGVRTAHYQYTFKDIAAALYEGSVPIPLVSGCPLHRGGAPHWAVVTGFDRDNLYVHDPHGGPSTAGGAAVHAPIPIAEFAPSAWRGAPASHGMVVIDRRCGA